MDGFKPIVMTLVSATMASKEGDEEEEALAPDIAACIVETCGSEVVSIDEAKSAQQRVRIVSLANGSRVVVRIWTSGSRWWNMNLSRNTKLLCRSEIAGYRIAKRFLPELTIPREIHVDMEKMWGIYEFVCDVEGLDDSWTTGMIKNREEFGYMEPHPRHGRVPVEQSLEYSLMVLRSVTIPLHRAMNEIENHKALEDIDLLDGWTTKGFSYQYAFLRMTREYRKTFNRMWDSFMGRPAVHVAKLRNALNCLRDAIDGVEREAFKLETPVLRPVLCHMDYQPQNMVFARETPDSPATISSVLDWEEAAYADPRFDLLLLCRKVAANREQAEIIWNAYRDEMPQPALGPIEPWLQLEGVHSLTTLLLQAMSLLNGGRAPWESKPELWGKIEREFQRLVDGGWNECARAALPVDPSS